MELLARVHAADQAVQAVHMYETSTKRLQDVATEHFVETSKIPQLELPRPICRLFNKFDLPRPISRFNLVQALRVSPTATTTAHGSACVSATGKATRPAWRSPADPLRGATSGRGVDPAAGTTAAGGGLVTAGNRAGKFCRAMRRTASRTASRFGYCQPSCDPFGTCCGGRFGQ